MRGIILWIAVGLAAVVTGVGLYATALQTSPAAIVTNDPAPTPTVLETPRTNEPAPSPDAHTETPDDKTSRIDDSDSDSDSSDSDHESDDEYPDD